MQHDWAILELWLVVELDFATALHGLSRDTATNHSDLYIRQGPLLHEHLKKHLRRLVR